MRFFPNESNTEGCCSCGCDLEVMFVDERGEPGRPSRAQLRLSLLAPALPHPTSPALPHGPGQSKVTGSKFKEKLIPSVLTTYFGWKYHTGELFVYFST